MARRVLISGITGMAGSHLVDYLAATHPDVEIFGTRRGTAQPDCHECRMNTAIRLHSPYVS